MDESEFKAQELKKERRFDPELKEKGLRCDLDQYEMLKRCSDKNDMTEWNQWREEHSEYFVEDVLLEGGDFKGWYLKEVNLGTFRQYGYRTPEVFLCKANFDGAHLERADLQFSHVEEARFHEAHLESAKCLFGHFDKTFLLGIHLEDANLQCAKLQRTNVCNAHLNRANLVDSELEGSEFDNACLIGTKFRKARVSGATSFCYCDVDRKTDFREVGIGAVRIDPARKQLLEYNIRRKNWEEWYGGHGFLKWPVRWFWLLSDYGRSTWWIIIWFFGLALVFAGIYGYWAYSSPPGIVSDLMVEPHLPASHYFALLLVRPFYFSVVTMTTLGFGDMHADPQSVWGHILLTVQVILGYVLLGALVTRFAVLFTAGGPAGKFADEEKGMEAKKGA